MYILFFWHIFGNFLRNSEHERSSAQRPPSGKQLPTEDRHGVAGPCPVRYCTCVPLEKYRKSIKLDTVKYLTSTPPFCQIFGQMLVENVISGTNFCLENAPRGQTMPETSIRIQKSRTVTCFATFLAAWR